MIGVGLLSEEKFWLADEFADRVLRATSVLAEAGVTRGSAVALLLRNGTTFVEASMAAQNLGAYAVPINWHFATPEIAYVLGDCGAQLLIGDDDLLLETEGAIPDHIRIFSVGDRPLARPTTHWNARVAISPPSTAPKQIPVESMIYTSGTTGRPKGVRRAPPTPEQAIQTAAMRARIYGHEPGMCALLAAPLYHSAPNYFALNTVRIGGSLILERKFDAEETLRLIERHQVTHMFMVPTMFVRLLGLPQDIRQRFDLSSLRWVLHAGAPCPAHIKAAMIKWWGPVLNEYYGSTELGPLTFCTSQEWLQRPNTVGRALDGVAFTICDDAGSACAPGEAGEICVERIPQADFTYHGNDAKRQAMKTGAGLGTGDIGYVDEDGYLYICDRRTDMIISGGVNIYPAEIEAALMQLQEIADCAVLGIPDTEFGEKVVAFLEFRPGAHATEAEVEAALRSRIAGYKIPRIFHFSEKLPRDESGKIFKRKLREHLLAADV